MAGRALRARRGGQRTARPTLLAHAQLTAQKPQTIALYSSTVEIKDFNRNPQFA